MNESKTSNISSIDSFLKSSSFKELPERAKRTLCKYGNAAKENFEECKRVVKETANDIPNALRDKYGNLKKRARVIKEEFISKQISIFALFFVILIILLFGFIFIGNWIDDPNDYYIILQYISIGLLSVILFSIFCVNKV